MVVHKKAGKPAAWCPACKGSGVSSSGRPCVPCARRGQMTIFKEKADAQACGKARKKAGRKAG